MIRVHQLYDCYTTKFCTIFQIPHDRSPPALRDKINTVQLHDRPAVPGAQSMDQQ